MSISLVVKLNNIVFVLYLILHDMNRLLMFEDLSDK